jgi:hypothetical protein
MQTLTPDRSITVEFDRPGSVQVEPYFAKRRSFFEIQKPILNNVEQLASGTWIIKPSNSSLSFLHETSAGQASIIRLTEFNHPASVQELPLQRSHSDLTGVTPAVAVSSSGDHFMTKRITAGASWDLDIGCPRGLPSLPSTPNYPLDCVLNSKTAPDPADTGYIVRWVHPAHHQELIDYLFVIKFGGELTPSGYGEFSLTVCGDGRCVLYEWIEGEWVKVDEWLYAPAELAPGTGHTLRILPHAARWIEFKANVNDRAASVFQAPSQRRASLYGQQVSPNAHLYEAKNRGNLPRPANGLALPMTGAGSICYCVRRDLRLWWQFARIRYPASGTIEDDIFTVPQVNFSSHVLAVRTFSMVLFNPLTMVPYGSTSAVAINAITGATLTPGSETWLLGSQTITLNGYQLPGRPNGVKIRATLTNANPGGPYSPWFFGYEAFKLGENNNAPNSPFVIDGSHYRQSPCTRINISSAGFEPSYETASLRVADLVNRCTRLRTRSEGTVRISTTYDPAQPNKTAVLFDGYWTRSEAQLRGKAGKVYPSPEWHDLEMTCLGQWKRLAERDFVELEQMTFATDPNVTTPAQPENGNTPPWKVTDAIRYLLAMAGIAESQISVPDLPIRLYWNGPTHEQAYAIRPGEHVGEYILKLAKDYLNAYLIWDANAFTDGAWRLKFLPKGTESAIWTFTDDPPTAGRLATHPGAYPSNTTWIARDSLFEWGIPAENSWVRVVGQYPEKQLYPQELENPKMFNRPGANTADPDHPDYIDGRFKPLYHRYDSTLKTPQAVQWVARRLFDIACRSQRYARFACPLPLVNAASIEPTVYTTHTHRPLMYGDVVNYRRGGVTRKAMVTQCNIRTYKQHHMMGLIEVQLFNTLNP